MAHGPESGINTGKSTLDREAELFGSLKDNLWNSVKDHLADSKGTIVFETATAVGFGAGLAALTKNPALLGAAVEPLVKASIHLAAKAGIVLAAADWSVKVGVPAYDVWKNPDHLEANKKVIAHNVGSGLVDYAAMGIGGIAGGGIAWKITPELDYWEPPTSWPIGGPSPAFLESMRDLAKNTRNQKSVVALTSS